VSRVHEGKAVGTKAIECCVKSKFFLHLSPLNAKMVTFGVKILE